MTSDVSFSTALKQQSNTTGAQTGLAEDFAQFLNLLTVQLQHQDPLDPMDTNELTNQLVAFTGVEQQINTNQKLDSLVSLQLNNAFSASMDYIGNNISYVSAELYYDGATPNKISYILEEVAADAKMRIYDSTGTEIFSTDVSGNIGQQSFTWDGLMKNGQQAPEGTYSVRIDALDNAGKGIESTTAVTGRVRGVESQNGVIYLLVGDRAIAQANVLNASEPPPPASDDAADDGTDDGTSTETST